jgi:hypothetical protein
VAHIGLPKTGTTSLQQAFNALRPQLRKQGVIYPETGTAKAINHHRGASWLVDAPLTYLKDPTPREAWWRPMREELRKGRRTRGLISYEMLCIADRSGVERVKSELGAKAHAVIVLRHLGDLMTSYWQESIKRGVDTSLDDWVRHGLSDRGSASTSGAFHRKDGVGLFDRWTSVFGAENVTVITLDSPSRLFDAFESMLDLPAGLLATGLHTERANRSMTAPEAALVRRLNETLLGEWGLTTREHRRLVLRGMVRRLLTAREPAADEPKIMLPGWAQEGCQELGRQIAAEVRASGARIVGDLGELERPTAVAEHDTTELPSDIPTDLIIESILGITSQATGRDLGAR